MESFIAYRKPSRLTTLLTFVISLTFMVTWLPLLRSILDGSTYQWGMTWFGLQFSGAGINRDIVFLLVQLLFYAALMVSMYRVRNRSIYHGLLVVWFIHVFGNLLSEIIINGDTLFQGDTLNVSISLTSIIIPLSILAFALILLEIRADRKAEPVQIPWTSKNSTLAWIIFGMLPIQALLLATGEPHGLTDEIGVILTILQCFLIPLILRPYPASALAPDYQT